MKRSEVICCVAGVLSFDPVGDRYLDGIISSRADLGFKVYAPSLQFFEVVRMARIDAHASILAWLRSLDAEPSFTDSNLCRIEFVSISNNIFVDLPMSVCGRILQLQELLAYLPPEGVERLFASSTGLIRGRDLPERSIQDEFKIREGACALVPAYVTERVDVGSRN